MKVFIVTDLEGPAMVFSFEQISPKNPESREAAMTLLTHEVNACVDGVLDADPKAEVIVWDGHGPGGIDVLQFHPRAKLLGGKGLGPPYTLDKSFNAVFFVGQHAMQGTPNAPLAHTYWSGHYEYFKLNGQYMGEFGCRAVLAGTLGIPTVFVAGDDKAVKEARSLVPNIYAVATKVGLGISSAVSLSPQRSCESIRKTAKEAALNIDKIEPVRMDPPFEQEIRVVEGESIDGFLAHGAEKLDGRTVVFRSDDITKLHV